jgi:hypothetical protein
MGGESGEGSLGIGVVAAEFLGRLELVAAIRAVLIVDQDGARRQEFTVDLRNGNDEAMSSQDRRSASNRCGDLKDFRREKNPRVAAGRSWTINTSPPRTVRRGKFGHLGLVDRQGAESSTKSVPGRVEECGWPCAPRDVGLLVP